MSACARALEPADEQRLSRLAARVAWRADATDVKVASASAHLEPRGKCKGGSTMTSHRIGTREEWLAASAELLESEKELTRMGR
jgi:hypothetical protein